MRFHIGLAEATGSARLVAAMTEVQGAMTDLISHIAHPPEVLEWSNAAARASCSRRSPPATPPAPSRAMIDHLAGTEHVLAGLSSS